uniref:NADH-ubiquinone oxidoreductase chain 3 n=1 Tax=Leptynoptera sulfurea TaxID=1950150 RepID=A0A344A2I0_9HEMI|nr:NADH dehydrogenase subunit 3 [Leptynoptera sulfurea]AWU48971.1 NADH dehydrogenase subunit 3 [Leptynoptera sulfurea]
MLMFMFMFSTLLILILIMNMIFMINHWKSINREKNSPFECGFDPFSKSRNSFSIHFFCISLMFLIFDIEITIVIPTTVSLNFITTLSWINFCSIMFTILFVGLIIEWAEGSMEWK